MWHLARRCPSHNSGARLGEPVPPPTLADQTVLKVQRARVRMVTGKGLSLTQTHGQPQTVSKTERERRIGSSGIENGNQDHAGSGLEWNADQHLGSQGKVEGSARRPREGRRSQRKKEVKTRHTLTQDEELAVAVLRPPTEEVVATHNRRGSGIPTQGPHSEAKGQGRKDKGQGEEYIEKKSLKGEDMEIKVQNRQDKEGKVQNRQDIDQIGEDMEDKGQYRGHSGPLLQVSNQSVENISSYVKETTEDKDQYISMEDKGHSDIPVEDKGQYDISVKDGGEVDESVADWIEGEEEVGGVEGGGKRHVYSYRSAPKSADVTRTSSGEAGRTRLAAATSASRGGANVGGAGDRPTSGRSASGRSANGRSASGREATLDQDFLLPREYPSRSSSSSSDSPSPENPVAMATRLSDVSGSRGSEGVLHRSIIMCQWI